LTLPQSEFWLLVADEVPCGYLHFWVVASEGSLLSMAVVPEARRKGLGRALMTQLKRRLGEHDCAEVHLEVRASNLPAQGLYRAVGFRENGRRKGYYSDTGEDALLMSRILDRADPAE
jgi:ribosomal-protein-alanine N-acetyltransferase